MEENFVDVQNLHFQYQGYKIFDDVNLNIAHGKITAIMGPSGSGKTTLLKLIGGQLYPTSGKIIIDGENIHELSRAKLYRARRKMGMLFQSGALFTNLSVFDNVAFPIREHTNLNSSMVRDLVLIKLEAVGLRGARKLMPSELSGGMARRVALARALALDPQMMMYDEPFTGQDPITMGVLVKLIKTLNDILGITSIIVSHDVPETIAISDYVYVLSDGKIIGEGTPEDLSMTTADNVKQFIQGLPDGPVPFQYPCIELSKDIFGIESELED